MFQSSERSLILFIFQLPPPVHGVAMVNQRIQNSAIINETFQCEYINLTGANSINDIDRFQPDKVIKGFRVYWQTLKALVLSSVHLVYITPSPKGFSFYRDVLLILMIKIFRKKIVLHLHGQGMISFAKHWQRWLCEVIFRKTHVIHLSDRLFEDICFVRSTYVRHTLANGIPDYYKDHQYDGENKLRILFLAALMESKGPLTLLKAVNILKEKVQANLEIWLVGNMWKESFQQTLIDYVKEHQLGQVVHFLGPKFDEDKWAIFSKADLYVLPTEQECFPLTILEAMQFELPVISTFEGAIPEIIDDGQTGFLVPAKNPEALAKKISLFLENPDLLKTMGVAGRKKFLENYTLEKFETRLRDMLSEILSS
ncbi:MAG: glycosyltransferase family 4 protein [SAR324 cluster bacterium]|nr:glycosyltransferase family 4 protein [SAR324 cluster bacterium]